MLLILIFIFRELSDMNIPETSKGKKQFQPYHIINVPHIGYIFCVIQLKRNEMSILIKL